MTLVNEILRIRHLDLLVAPNLVDYFTYRKIKFPNVQTYIHSV